MNTGEIGSPPSKIKLLNERWQEIQQQIDREKQYRSQTVEEQINHLDDKLTNSRTFNQQKMQVLNEKINKVKGDLMGITEQKQEMFASVDKKVAKIEEGVLKEIQSEKQVRLEYTASWIKKSDEKLLDVCNSMENITTEKGETVEAISVRIKKKLNQLEQAIAEEKNRREEECASLAAGIQQQLAKMYDELQIQKKARDQTARKIEAMLKQIGQKLQTEIEEERKLRKQTNNSLLHLLQETCIKVQKAFQ